MLELVTEENGPLAKQCEEYVGYPILEPNVTIAFKKADEVVGIFTFANFTGREIWLSCWASTQEVWERENYERMLDYPFRQCGVTRCCAMTRADNYRANRAASTRGWTKEAVFRKYFDDEPGGDAVLYTMLKEDWESLYG